MFSDPVTGDKFFGRSETLELLTKRANGLKDGYRQNIAILGPQLMGKSSLILQFLSRLSHPALIPIYIEVRKNSFSNFVYKFLGAVLYHYLKAKNLPVHEDLELLKKEAEKNLPKTVEFIRGIEQQYKSGNLERAFEEVIGLTAVFKQESNISCMLILDGFHFLDTFRIKNTYSKLAREIMTQKDTMYIFISSQLSYAKRILANELSLLFGNFEVINLEPFDYSTCCKFLEQRFETIFLPAAYRDFLITFSKGHPFYLDIMSAKLKEKAKELNYSEVNYRLISQAMHEVIYDSKGILNQYFTTMLTHNLNGADYANYLPILLSASEKGCRPQEIARLTLRQPKVIAKQMNSLVEKDLLNKIGVFYRIQDKIFRFWLKSVYQRKRLSLTADPQTESDDFCIEIEQEILAFSEHAHMQLVQRIENLFKSFKNEIVTLQNKRFKFWHFEEVRTWDILRFTHCLIARYKDGYWVAMVKQGDISEADIQEFHRAIRVSTYPIRKTIIIACKKMELNVRLMALEKKFWIWDLADLNTILDLYGKQQVMG
ncbi:MAG: hypothetical protein V1727_03340 [Candidatus Omnitrophota bacterium]